MAWTPRKSASAGDYNASTECPLLVSTRRNQRACTERFASAILGAHSSMYESTAEEWKVRFSYGGLESGSTAAAAMPAHDDTQIK